MVEKAMFNDVVEKIKYGMFNSKDYWDNRYSSGGNSGTGSYEYMQNLKLNF